MGQLLNLIGASTGVALYALLLAMVLRAPRARDRRESIDPLALATAVLGLVWNLCSLPLYGLPHLGVADGLLRGVSALGFSALGFLPAVVVHSVLRMNDDRIHALPHRVLTAAAYASSSIAAFLHVRALALGSSAVPAPAGMRLLTSTFVAIVLPVIIITRHQAGARRAVWVAALAVFSVSAIHLTSLHTGQDPWQVELLGHHASIPLALAILCQDYPFAFADLFLKRALTLVALVVGAFIGMAVADAGGRELLEPRQTGLIISFWVATALAYPRLLTTISWFVDAVLLKRPDYRSLRATVARRLQAHDRVPSLLDDITILLAPALGGDSTAWSEIPESFAPIHDDGAAGGLIVVADGTIRLIIPTSDHPQYVLTSHPLKVGRRLLSSDILVLETIAVIVARRIDAIRLTHERCERELREEEMAKLATEAELRALRAQINPHFLFNALTTIGYLIQVAPPRAFGTLMQLTTLLRSVLRSEGEFTTLGHELGLIEAYLEIERARFEDRLQVRIDVPAGLQAARLPPLLLQPLVENAIKHGVAPKRAGARVTVRARLGERSAASYELAVTVEDTGAGATDVALQRGRERGVGLRNVESRLAGQYGAKASLAIRSVPGRGTTVEIRLPVSAWVDAPALKAGA